MLQPDFSCIPVPIPTPCSQCDGFSEGISSNSERTVQSARLCATAAEGSSASIDEGVSSKPQSAPQSGPYHRLFATAAEGSPANLNQSAPPKTAPQSGRCHRLRATATEALNKLHDNLQGMVQV